MRKMLLGVFASLAFVIVAVPAYAKGPMPKVDVCHYDADADSYHKININGNALQAHLNHGDALPSSEGFDADCGEVKEWSLLETVTVDSASQAGGISTAALEAGKEYKIVVSGTWTNRPGETVDAEYSTVNNVDWTDAPDGGYPAGLLDLQVNNDFVDWGSYMGTHEYEYLYTPLANGSVSFRVFDGDANTNTLNPGWYGDNVGSLTVEIYGN